MFGNTVRRRFCTWHGGFPGNSVRRRRRGSVYALIMVALPVLVGAGALAVDLGLMTTAAQRVRHVSDTAALAGARCHGDASGTELAVEQIVGANNATSPWQVSPQMRCFAPGDEVPGHGPLGPREYAVEVTGQTQFHFGFARLLGLETADIARRSVARATVLRNRLQDGFLFAGSTDPTVYGLGILGDGICIDGSIHTNTGVYLRGSDMTVTGDVHYKNAYHQDGANFTVGGEVCEADVREYPVDFTWEEFDCGPWDHEVASIYVGAPGDSLAPGRWRVRGDMTIDGTGFSCNDALFLVDGDIRFNGSGAQLDRVTMVARGSIVINGGNGVFSPFVEDLLAFSTKASSPGAGGYDWAVLVNGSECELAGILYAPEGTMAFVGEEGWDHGVGLIAERLAVLGSNTTHLGPESAHSSEYVTDVRLVL